MNFIDSKVQGDIKVLFVDDETETLEVAEEFIEKSRDGISVETATSTEEGLELIEEKDYDAIVSDYLMPETNGLDFLEIIREEKEIDIPFIVFTGKGREDVAMEALNLGADRYFQKGGNPRLQYDVLAQAIAQVVEYYRTGKKLQSRERILSEVLEGDPVPTFVIDEDHKVIFWNEALENITDIEASEVVVHHKKSNEVTFHS